jgi:hypothetical protein
MVKSTKSNSSTGTDDAATTNSAMDHQFQSLSTHLQETLNNHFDQQGQRIDAQDQRIIALVTEVNQSFMEQILVKWDKRQESIPPTMTQPTPSTFPIQGSPSGNKPTLLRHSNPRFEDSKNSRPPVHDHHSEQDGFRRDDEWRQFDHPT